MCGIAGIWNFAALDITDTALDRFTDSLSHRGPDGRGVFRDSACRLSLCHRRLAIIDLSETGSQPMRSHDGRYVITFNGEIYNHPEIRAELEALGHVFRGTSDTETLLAAYAQWGRECQRRLNGMWAFAVWDRRERLLFLSRDRFGVKPLHYVFDGRRFAFASEMKAFLYIPGFRLEHDPSIVARGLANYGEVEGSEDCILRGVKRLMGGYCMVVRAGEEPKVERWWNTLENLHAPPGSRMERIEKFRELFMDACRIRTRSDVPIASALSGGLDSSSVFSVMAGAAANGNHARPRAFVASFKGTIQDEREYAEEVVRRAGAEAVFREMDPMENAGALDETLYHFEEIYDLPTTAWILYKKMSGEGMKVSIDGHGGDELLAGYPHYTELAMRSASWPGVNPFGYAALKSSLAAMYPKGAINTFPAFRRDFVNGAGAFLREKAGAFLGGHRAEKWKKAVIYGCGAGGLAALDMAAANGWEVLYFVDGDAGKWGTLKEGYPVRDPAALSDRDYDLVIVASAPGGNAIFESLERSGMVYGKDFIFYRDKVRRARSKPVWPAGTFRPEASRAPWLRVRPPAYSPPVSGADVEKLSAMDVVNRRLYADFHFTILPSILRNFDRMSMASGVEIRAPFMDWRLVCHAFSLPWTDKIGGGYSKRVLREAMRGILPEKVRTRKDKIGFASPLAQWLSGPLKEMALDTAASRDFLESDIWRGPDIRKAVEGAYRSGDMGLLCHLWVYLQTGILMRVFAQKAASAGG